MVIRVENTEKYFRDNDPVLVDGKLYYSTDKKRLKIGSGAKWSVTDYVPRQLIRKSSGPIGNHWIFQCDDNGMIVLPGEDLGF
ncbi:MAG: hypothetical protein V4608_03395 [Bacteroidota bacterium]